MLKTRSQDHESTNCLEPTPSEISYFWKIPEKAGENSPAPEEEEGEEALGRRRNNSYDSGAPNLQDVIGLRDKLQERLEGGNKIRIQDEDLIDIVTYSISTF